MSLFPKKEDGGLDVKSMWEVKLLKYIGLFFVYLVFVMYLLLAVPSAWSWAELKYYTASLEIEQLDGTIINLFEQDKGRLAMDLIYAYPPENVPKIVETLGSSTSYLNAHYFFYISNAFYQLGDVDEALFWNTVGHFRMRYDALRCNSETADEFATAMAELATRPELMNKMKNDPPESVARRLERTLAWDERYPPKNQPEYACDLIARLQGLQHVETAAESRWEAMRYLLRHNAEEYIAEFKAHQEDQLYDFDTETEEADE